MNAAVGEAASWLGCSLDVGCVLGGSIRQECLHSCCGGTSVALAGTSVSLAASVEMHALHRKKGFKAALHLCAIQHKCNSGCFRL